MDTIERKHPGLKIFFYSVIDLQSRFAFSWACAHCNSHNSLDLWQRFQAIYPLAVQSVQTDNGNEFLWEFVTWVQQYTAERFIYPQCPKSTAALNASSAVCKENLSTLMRLSSAIGRLSGPTLCPSGGLQCTASLSGAPVSNTFTIYCRSKVNVENVQDEFSI